LAKSLPNAVVIDATQPLEAVIRRTAKETLTYMRRRRLKRSNHSESRTPFQTSPGA
jgi:hypothetical protein